MHAVLCCDLAPAKCLLIRAHVGRFAYFLLLFSAFSFPHPPSRRWKGICHLKGPLRRVAREDHFSWLEGEKSNFAQAGP